jgi:hypothetical protein
MCKSVFVLLTAVGSSLLATPASGADLSAMPRLGWALAFGGVGSPPAPTLTLALDATAGRNVDGRHIIEADAAAVGAGLRVAGLPLWSSRFALAQDANAPAVPATEPAAAPWYTRSWVLWTAGGLAATAAVLGSLGGGSTEEHNRQVSGSGSSLDVGPVSGSFGSTDGENGQYEVCAAKDTAELPDACAPVNTGFRERPRDRRLRDQSDTWLDAGTGHMGDLIAR